LINIKLIKINKDELRKVEHARGKSSGIGQQEATINERLRKAPRMGRKM
jgi:hypothetical protein